jgi:hypothetical protein
MSRHQAVIKLSVNTHFSQPGPHPVKNPRLFFLAIVGNIVPIYLTPNVENPSDELKLVDPISLHETLAAVQSREMQCPSVDLYSSSA